VASSPSQRVVVGISGATGVIYGIRLLETARDLDIETHLVISDWGRRTIRLETDRHPEEVRDLGTFAYDEHDLAAAVADPTFPVDGMAIVPCSMRTLAAIANERGENLVHRAAEVSLGEGRPLVLAVRESPLSLIHLQNLLVIARRGAIVAPPVPAFYARPRSLDEMVDHTVGRILDLLGIEHDRIRRWGHV
jgi:4-hydroxy-3-polyprenylbenzoate decarboxylase